MGELKDFLYSMIRNGDEFEAEKVLAYAVPA